MMAAKEGNAANVVELIKEGADIDLQDRVCLHLTLCMRPHFLMSIIDYLSSHRVETLL